MCIHLFTDINQDSGGSTMVSVASSCGCSALLISSHLNETIRARQRAGPGYDSDRADMVCHYRELKILWERFRCELNDSESIVFELSRESSRPVCGRMFSRFLDSSRIVVICRPLRGERVSFLFARVLPLSRWHTRSSDILVGSLPLQNHGLLHELYCESNHQVC